MPKYTKKSKFISQFFPGYHRWICLDRPPRTKTARSGADDSASIDDGVSTCSNLSDVTSVYAESEGKLHRTTNLNSIVLTFQLISQRQMTLLLHRIISKKNLTLQSKDFEIKSVSPSSLSLTHLSCFFSRR